jgi:hypothetical protein
MMSRLLPACAVLMAAVTFGVAAQESPYKVLRTDRVGGTGGFDYVYADEAERALYIARAGNPGRISVFNLDTLEPVGEMQNISAHGVAVSARSHHGFSSSKPVVMWDAKTLAPIKTIDVDGAPDGIFSDSFSNRVYVFSHTPPHVTVINASDGSTAGTIDLGGAPEQAASDGNGLIYVDIVDKDRIAVIDTTTMTVRSRFELAGAGGACAGLAMDVMNQVLFASCRRPNAMVMVSAVDGKILASLPIGQGTDGAAFNPATSEAFSSQGDGTLTVIKESSPTGFTVEQNVQTMRGARTLTLDARTGRIFVVSAEFGPPPVTPMQGGSSQRGPVLPGSFSILVVGR